MTARRRYLVLLLALLVAWSSTRVAWAQAAATLEPARFEQEIRAFEEADRVAPPATNGIVFTGSSSIRLWVSLREDFQGLPVMNRGFGGSTLPEVTAFAPRIVIPYAPRLVVVYCGGNDINGGRTAEQVAADFKAFVARIHQALPETRIAYISIAPNPARWSQVDTVKAANRAIEAYTKTDRRLTFIDVFPKMLGPDGRPKPEIFVEDGLHMNEKGYALWREIVRPYLSR
jgi:lysophospholipase L1-like esterase